MLGWRKVCCALPLIMVNICVAQNAVETNLYLAFNKEGPIALAQVASVNGKEQGADEVRGTLTLAIGEQLRGESLPGSMEIPFVWISPSSQSYIFTYLKRPPPQGFERVRPVQGMHVLVMFPRRKPAQSMPLAVLNLDSSEDSWVPLIRRAVEMNSLAGEARNNSLIAGLSDASKFIRVTAMHGLLQGSGCMAGSDCRGRAVSVLLKNAMSGPEGDRLDAIDWIAHRFYDASAGETAPNRNIAVSLVGLVTDSDKKIRDQAITDLDEMLSPALKWHPDLSKIAASTRDAVLRELHEEEQAGGDRAEKAQRLEDSLGMKK